MKIALKVIYRWLVDRIKILDAATSNKLGDFFRNLTNMNTKKYWDKLFSENNDFLRDYPYRPLRDILPKDREFTLLDIGCAMGDGLELLKKDFPKAKFSGADMSTVGIEKAKSKTKEIDYFVFDLREDSLPKKYDFIILMHILEHLNDPFPAVDKCLKYVNEALIICTPYIEHFACPRLYLPGEHRYLFNEDTLRNYNCEVLRISEHIEAGGYKYILYKLRP